MCEYCGCQQIAAIDELTREHDTVVDIAERLRFRLEAGRTEGVAELCRGISAVLGPHTVVEEEGLFPAMRAEFPDHVDDLRAEHRRIHEVLNEASDGAPADPGWSDRLIKVLFLLREHILKEQDGVFPAALMTLDSAQWERLDAVRARVGSALTRD